MKHLFILLLVPQIILAMEPSRDIASTDLKESFEQGGNLLIYNCVEKHWECVTQGAYSDCEEKKEKDLKNEESFTHTCAPMGEFPGKRACEQRILYLTSHNYGTNFCIKEEWSLKPIKL